MQSKLRSSTINMLFCIQIKGGIFCWGHFQDKNGVIEWNISDKEWVFKCLEHRIYKGIYSFNRKNITVNITTITKCKHQY